MKTVKNLRKMLEMKNRALILKVWPEVGPNGLKMLTDWTGPKLGPSPTIYKCIKWSFQPLSNTTSSRNVECEKRGEGYKKQYSHSSSFSHNLSYGAPIRVLSIAT